MTKSQRIPKVSHRLPLLFALLLFYSGDMNAKEKKGDKRDYSNEVSVLTTKVSNRENIGSLIKKEFEKPISARKYFPFEQRLVDAEFFFETGQYDKAAVILSDLAERPELKQRTDRFYVLNKLASALYLDGNYLAAKRYFKELLTPAAGSYYQNALAALMEISLKLNDFSDDETISGILARTDLKSLEPETLYAFGKYLFNTGNKVRSVDVFLAIPANSPFYVKGLYFTGTALVGMKQYDNALKYFSDILAVKPAGEKESFIFDLARLAVARLLGNAGKTDESVEHYSQIEPGSPVYGRALYEQAWIFLKKKDYEGALHPIEVLLLYPDEKDPELGILAKTLKGRILTKLNRLNDASETFEELVNDYYPIEQELKTFSSKEDEMMRYFSSFIYKHSEKFALELPMTSKAAKWLSSDKDMAAIIGIFDGLSIQKNDIQESLETVQKIKWALKEKNRIEMMPEVKRMNLKIQEEENQILLLLNEIADLLDEMSLPAVSQVELATFTKILQARKGIEAEFKGIPATTEDYDEREKKISQEYFGIQQQIYNLETVLHILRQQILSAEEWIKGEEFKEGKEKADEKVQQEFLSQIKAEKTELKILYDQLSSLKNEVEMSLLSMKAGSEIVFEEQNLKLELLKKLAEETGYLKAIVHKLGEPDKSLGLTLVSLADRLSNLYHSFGPTKKAIDG
ncbi:MAG: hypothetical protein FJ088_06545, partial [Deltaproteobacteria bacterium]|nr:hypothetical protein [Deltaproteobacteria bacterium]